MIRLPASSSRATYTKNEYLLSYRGAWGLPPRLFIKVFMNKFEQVEKQLEKQFSGPAKIYQKLAAVYLKSGYPPGEVNRQIKNNHPDLYAKLILC